MNKDTAKRRFYRRFFIAGLTASGAAGADGTSGLAVSDAGVSGLAWPDSAAISRGGAPSGRGDGNSGAIRGIESQTSHWQIL